MNTRTWNRMKRLQLALARRQEVETLSGMRGRVVAIGFDGIVTFVNDRDGAAYELRPFSFSKVDA